MSGQMIRCDRCGRAQVFEVEPTAAMGATILAYVAATRVGWTWYGNVDEFLCPPCSLEPIPSTGLPCVHRTEGRGL